MGQLSLSTDVSVRTVFELLWFLGNKKQLWYAEKNSLLVQEETLSYS